MPLAVLTNTVRDRDSPGASDGQCQTACARPQISLLIYDLVTGRLKSGHQEDYLAALEEALADYAPGTFAPFRKKQARGAVPAVTLAPGDRLRRWLLGYKGFRRALSADMPLLAIAPNPGPLDFVLGYLAILTSRKYGRGRVAMFMRRDAQGLVGPGLRARILERIVCYMARSERVYMISDTRMAADYWQARTGRTVRLVSIPVRKSPNSLSNPTDDTVRVGLLGGFRREKGAAHYGDVISVALGLALDVRVECQYSEEPAKQPEREFGRALEAWADEPRVTIYRGHLSSDAYTALLYACDVVVLPYEVESYGQGTSGVLFEALAAGRLIIATRISWAVNEYRDHPNIVWLDRVDRPSLHAAMRSAIDRVRNGRQQRARATTVPDRFESTWVTVIEEIGREMSSADSRRQSVSGFKVSDD